MMWLFSAERTVSMKVSAVKLVIILCVSLMATAFNIDSQHPLVFVQDKQTATSPSSPTTTTQNQSLFGFSVALSFTRHTAKLFVGAPKANTDKFQQCSLFGTKNACSNITLKEPKVEYQNASLLGASIGVYSEKVVVCTVGRCFILTTRGYEYEIENSLIGQSEESLLGMAVYVHVGDKNQYLLIGDPGFSNGYGQVFIWNILDNFKEGSLTHIPFNTKDGYLGYTVSSGVYSSDGQIIVAIGQPKGVNNRGAVILGKIMSNGDISFLATLNGENGGDYFGGSVLTIDLNGDGQSEIIVGAPLATTGSGSYDTGLVYVYKKNNRNFYQLSIRLFGSKKTSGRFGTSLTSLLDLNYDGCKDFAVGEPFGDDGRGIVHIFFGNPEIRDLQSQIIFAKKIDQTLRGFGYSFSRGFDIDGNNYPDLAVGAPISGHVVVLRSKPVIRFNATLSATPRLLDTSVEKLNLSACFNYSGAFAPKTLELNVIVKDSSSHKDSNVTQNGELIINKNQTLEVNNRTCLNFPVNLTMTMNFASPLNFHLEFKIVCNERNAKSEPSETFYETCPIINPYLPEQKEIFLQVPFLVGCGSDGECQTDLKVSAFPLNLSHIIGSGKYITLQIHVNNLGEAASLPLLELNVPSGLSLVQMPPSCVRGQHTISCRIFPNPFYNTSLYNQSFEFETTDLDQWPTNMAEQWLQFDMSVRSNSLEQNQDDNQFSAGLVLQRQAYVDISGKTSRETIVLGELKQTPNNGTESNVSTYNINHTITIEKHLPSPIGVEVTIKAPLAIIDDSNEPLTIFQYEHQYDYRSSYNNSKPVVCTTSYTSSTSNERGSASLSALVQETLNSTLNVQCGQSLPVQCYTVTCGVIPMVELSDIFTFILKLKWNLTNIEQLPALSAVDRVLVTTTATVYIDDVTLLEDGTPTPRKRETSVITQLLLPDLQPQRQPVWILIASVVGALVLLAIIIYGLYRFGLFQRKKHEELQLELQLKDK